MRTNRLLAGLVAVAMFVSACSDDGPRGGTTDNDGAGGLSGSLSILTRPATADAMTRLVEAYGEHPDAADVELTTGSLPKFRQLIEAGDIDLAIVPKAGFEQSGIDLPSGPIGRRLAVIAVPSGNPDGVADVSVFATDSGLRTGVCSAPTIYGDFAVALLARSGVTPDPATVVDDCDGALMEVSDGALDAVFLGRPSFALPPGIELVEPPEEQNFIFEFALVVLEESPETRSFIAFLASDTAREILTEEGWLP